MTADAMTLARARALLGLDGAASAQALRTAYRDAVKRTHPDRAGGSATAFRDVVEAYHLLSRTGSAPPREPPPARARPRGFAPSHGGVLPISPEMAAQGGEITHFTDDGRRLRIDLPAGLRAGDKVRADDAEWEIVVRGDGRVVVRGDDVWMEIRVPRSLLEDGGRLALETPLGRRVLWVTRKTADQGLLRLQGQGLPARGRHRQGHLFVRLTPEPDLRAARA